MAAFLPGQGPPRSPKPTPGTRLPKMAWRRQAPRKQREAREVGLPATVTARAADGSPLSCPCPAAHPSPGRSAHKTDLGETTPFHWAFSRFGARPAATSVPAEVRQLRARRSPLPCAEVHVPLMGFLSVLRSLRVRPPCTWTLTALHLDTAVGLRGSLLPYLITSSPQTALPGAPRAPPWEDVRADGPRSQRTSASMSCILKTARGPTSSANRPHVPILFLSQENRTIIAVFPSVSTRALPALPPPLATPRGQRPLEPLAAITPSAQSSLCPPSAEQLLFCRSCGSVSSPDLLILGGGSCGPRSPCVSVPLFRNPVHPPKCTAVPNLYGHVLVLSPKSQFNAVACSCLECDTQPWVRGASPSLTTTGDLPAYTRPKSPQCLCFSRHTSVRAQALCTLPSIAAHCPGAHPHHPFRVSEVTI